jgi:hypothetical protein
MQGGAFGGGQGPRQLGMFGQGGGQQQAPGLLEGFESRMNNPLIAGGLGFGSALLNSASRGESLGKGLMAGLGGGVGGIYGGMRAQRARMDEEERSRMMRALMERLGGLSNRPQMTPAFQPQGAVQGAYGQAPGLF